MRLLLYITHFHLLFQSSWYTWLLMLPSYNQHFTTSSSAIFVEGLSGSGSNLQKTKVSSWPQKHWKLSLSVSIAGLIFAAAYKSKVIKKELVKFRLQSKESEKKTSSIMPSKGVDQKWTLKLFGAQVTVTKKQLLGLSIFAVAIVAGVMLFEVVQILFFNEEGLVEEEAEAGDFHPPSVLPKHNFPKKSQSASFIGKTKTARKTTTLSDQQPIKSVVSEPAVKLSSGTEIGGFIGGGSKNQPQFLLNPVVKSPSDETTIPPSCTPTTSSTIKSTATGSDKGACHHFSNTPMGSMVKQLEKL